MLFSFNTESHKKRVRCACEWALFWTVCSQIKPTNNACAFKPRDSYCLMRLLFAGEIKNHLRIFEGHFGQMVKNWPKMGSLVKNKLFSTWNTERSSLLLYWNNSHANEKIIIVANCSNIKILWLFLVREKHKVHSETTWGKKQNGIKLQFFPTHSIVYKPECSNRKKALML